jgi:myosin heavy subunit
MAHVAALPSVQVKDRAEALARLLDTPARHLMGRLEKHEPVLYGQLNKLIQTRASADAHDVEPRESVEKASEREEARRRAVALQSAPDRLRRDAERLKGKLRALRHMPREQRAEALAALLGTDQVRFLTSRLNLKEPELHAEIQALIGKASARSATAADDVREHALAYQHESLRTALRSIAEENGDLKSRQEALGAVRREFQLSKDAFSEEDRGALAKEIGEAAWRLRGLANRATAASTRAAAAAIKAAQKQHAEAAKQDNMAANRERISAHDEEMRGLE